MNTNLQQCGWPAKRAQTRLLRLVLLVCCTALLIAPAAEGVTRSVPFPPPLESYGDAHMTSLWEVLAHRVQHEPFNLWATLLFLMAILHTFLTNKFLRWSRSVEARHRAQLNRALTGELARVRPTCSAARLLHFLGEVEVVFGIWVIPLFILMSAKLGWQQAVNYLNHGVRYVEPVFVVVIMIISSTRPVLQLAENSVGWLARRCGGGTGAWWLAILTLGPLLGSLITEPAAMTISALLLGRQFYVRRPKASLAYATLGLLFVNISVGGLLTHFAAPPVLMVTAPWGWNTPFMFGHFGWIALTGIVVSNLGYYFTFRRSILELNQQAFPKPEEPGDVWRAPIPLWVTIAHVLVLVWTVAVAHYPILIVGGFLFFVAFHEVTADYQSELQVRGPVLVGFFLAGLVIHGGLQQWWIEPLLGRMKELPLMLGALGLTAFNDNAAITYLATLVPNTTAGMKYAVVAGAVAGGGLTVIANAPNPAGQSILGGYFPKGIAPLTLLLGALPATVVVTLCFIFLGLK